jgi:hypothetical protein
LHTGTSSNDLELTGSIVGFGEPRYFYKDPVSFDDTFLNRSLDRILIKFATKKQRQFLYHFFELQYPTMFFVMGTILAMIAIFEPPQTSGAGGWILIIIFAIIFLLFGISSLINWFRVQTTQIPADLDIYMEETTGK